MSRLYRFGSALLAVLAILGCVSIAHAQQSTRLLWQYPGVENVVSAAWIEDLDGDTTPDILFESYDAGAPPVDHLFAISGRSSGTGTVIWSARPLGGPSNSGGYGEYCLQVGPDLTGDGVRDVLYGAAWGNRSAFLLNGMTGSTVWRFDTYANSPPSPPVSGWVYAVTPLGSDITGDGKSEVLFCAGSNNYSVYCANGVNGQILWHYRGPDAFTFVMSIADVNGDGIRDAIALQSNNSYRVIAFSGAGAGGGQPHILWNVPMPSSMVSACEIPISETEPTTIVVGCWNSRIYGLNARTGATRWNDVVGSPVMRVVPFQDLNNDGIKEIGVGSWATSGRVHSGANGATVWATPVGSDCWTVDPVDDTNGDGVQELAVGSFNGRVYLMNGVNGAILWSYLVVDKVFTVRGVPDLTGNGIPDVIAGTQYLNNRGGICYAFEGNDDILPAGVDSAPTAASLFRIGPNPSAGEMRWWWAPGPDPAGIDAAVEIFDPAGRLVRVLRPGASRPDWIQGRWDGHDEKGDRVPAGVYLGRLVTDGQVLATQRVVRLR